MTTSPIDPADPHGPTAPPPEVPANLPRLIRRRAAWVALLLAGFLAVLVALLIVIWDLAGAAMEATPGAQGSAGGPVLAIPLDARTAFLFIAVIGGALGGTVHALASLSQHIGKQ